MFLSPYVPLMSPYCMWFVSWVGACCIRLVFVEYYNLNCVIYLWNTTRTHSYIPVINQLWRVSIAMYENTHQTYTRTYYTKHDIIIFKR